MENFILGIVTLVISGLGFLSYKHPSIARQILKPLQYIILAIYLLFLFYNTVQSNSYYKAIDTTRITIDNAEPHDLNIDSLYAVVHDRDSIQSIIQNNRQQREKYMAVLTSQRTTKDSIQSNIRALLETNRENFNQVSLYLLIAQLTIIVFVILSYLFDKIHRGNDKDINDKTEQTAS